jgi:hypothetical protein
MKVALLDVNVLIALRSRASESRGCARLVRPARAQWLGNLHDHHQWMCPDIE